MKRREFIALVGGAATAWPLAARAEQQRRIGILMSLPESDPEGQRRLAAMQEELERYGWTKASGALIDIRWAGGQPERQQILARELVQLQPNVLIAQSTTAVIALLRETKTIPIVFVQITDPVGQGLVESLARPGGSVTGFSNFEPGIGGKWLELIKEIIPGITSVTIMFNPETAPYMGLYMRSVEIAASAYAVQVKAAPLHNSAEIEPAFMSISQPGSGLIFPPDVFVSSNRKLINALAIKHQLPAIHSFPYMAREDGLLSYGPDIVALYRQMTSYVDRVLRGAKPADLPVQQPIKYELVINLKTAKALGIVIPDRLLATADELIE